MTVGRIGNRWVQDGNTDGTSQWSPITSNREDRHVTCMALMDQAAMSPTLNKNRGHLQDNKCLHEQLDNICCCMDSQLGDHGFGYP
ncbi:hypothetical protein TNCV_4997171 [Trichonephila clavipes]|nr:hypothetical protein TNCV_4997171 [Trichonephila clavipes]